MAVIKLSQKDIRTVAKIVAEKAVEMNKKGATWRRGEEYLSCVEIGGIANKLLKPLEEKYDFDNFFKKSK